MIIVGNWKMNYTNDLSINKINTHHQYIICPAYIFLEKVYNNIISKYENISLGAQHVSDQNKMTGEISAQMLSEMNCKYCIIGHHERPKADYIIQINQLLKYNIIPILCISSIDEKDLKSIDELNRIIIAYEPSKNIGTGTSASTDQIERNAIELRNLGVQTILYGGSVTSTFKPTCNIDGVLVGKNSIPISDFLTII